MSNSLYYKGAKVVRLPKYKSYKNPFKFTEEKGAFSVALRNNPTEAEKLLWSKIKLGQIRDFRFQRQKVILGWIVDFYCAKRRLVIELDGDTHDAAKDAIRDKAMNKIGIYVMRFKNEEVFNNINFVINRIDKFLPVSGVKDNSPKPKSQPL